MLAKCPKCGNAAFRMLPESANATEVALYFDPRSPSDLSARIEQALAAPSDFVVARERFEDWDDVIDRYRHLMVLPSESSFASDAPLFGEKRQR